MTQHALLLVNLGSPNSTSVADVRSYLNQFLMDPYVVDLPWPIRRLLVSLILLKRPAESAHAYQSIWWDEGSPLVVISQRLAKQVEPLWEHGPVELAMRYAQPSIESAVLKLAKQGVKEITLFPLYPQFADSTTTTVIEETKRQIKQHNLSIKLNTVDAFYNNAAYIDALVASVKPQLEAGFDHLLLSFHGLPERHLHKNDAKAAEYLNNETCCSAADAQTIAKCYRVQCFLTAQAFAEKAGLTTEQWSVSFQSRLGRAKWIEPYTEQRLDELAKQGVKKLLVMSPAFVADCIETLEELGIRGKEQFMAAGGEELVLLPCLNDNAQWAQVVAGLGKEHVKTDS